MDGICELASTPGAMARPVDERTSTSGLGPPITAGGVPEVVCQGRSSRAQVDDRGPRTSIIRSSHFSAAEGARVGNPTEEQI